MEGALFFVSLLLHSSGAHNIKSKEVNESMTTPIGSIASPRRLISPLSMRVASRPPGGWPYGTSRVMVIFAVTVSLFAATLLLSASIPPAFAAVLGDAPPLHSLRDYEAVLRDRHASDIQTAFDLGLVRGKIDATGPFYDPSALITVGEMANVLARNYGAHSAIDGVDSVNYLSQLGITVSSEIQEALGATELESLARQTSSMVGLAELKVLSLARAGLNPAAGRSGITRGEAVSMVRSSTSSGEADQGQGLPSAVPGNVDKPSPGTVWTIADSNTSPGDGDATSSPLADQPAANDSSIRGVTPYRVSLFEVTPNPCPAGSRIKAWVVPAQPASSVSLDTGGLLGLEEVRLTPSHRGWQASVLIPTTCPDGAYRLTARISYTGRAAPEILQRTLWIQGSLLDTLTFTITK